MLSFGFIAILFTTAIAGPVPSPQSNEVSYITACEGASNCETYTDSNGRTRIRFVPGTEPGSADYAHRMTKRDSDYPKTQVTIGDSTLVWGCDIDPVQTLNNLSSVCATSGQCVSNAPVDISVQWITPNPGGMSNGPTTETLEISATGAYPSWLRNGMIEAIQAAARVPNLISWDRGQQYSSGITKARRDTAGSTHADTTPGTSGVCDLATFSSYVGISLYSSPDTLEATMDASVSFPTMVDGFCGSAQGLAVAGSVAGMFGAPGAVLAGIFGTIAASCA